MKPENKKFIKYLLIADLIVLLTIIVLGAIFIKDHHYERGKMLGYGMGLFFLLSNGGAILIRIAIRNMKMNKKDS